ncbi:MAG TPA: cytochrome c oxidase assembly protein [Stellaceae bacterium]|jgi:cytochrome c oxidase assembly protein Cox11
MPDPVPTRPPGASLAARRKRANLKVLALLGAILATMTVLVSYSETLYRLFCAATGYEGTTQRVAANDSKVASRTVTVRFSTTVAPGLPWRFVPAQRQVTLHLGQDTLAFFDATNLSDQDYVGHATFNVTPTKVGLYFKKIQCFCFTEERLGAHQTVEMPVDFFVDPGLGTDPDTQDVDTITLSYTFFVSRQPQGATDLARFDTKPNAVDGQKIFATRCAECHALTKNIFGPELGGVVGRKAGMVPAYPYSAGLKQSGIVWDAAALDKWLAGPQQDVPGALMPVSIADPRTRQDIIAYLESESAGAKSAAAVQN